MDVEQTAEAMAYDRGFSLGYAEGRADAAQELQPVAAMVEQFHRRFGCAIDGSITDAALVYQRRDLLDEEADELHDELIPGGDLTRVAKELADLVYVAYGAALALGIHLDQALAIVHRSNMSKLWDDGKPRYRADGKVLKPPTYVAPDLGTVVRG